MHWELTQQDWTIVKPRRWKQLGPDVIGEVKPDTFAGDLANLARRQPQRFARLALKFPQDVDLRYARAVISQFGETDPPAANPQIGDWAPADVPLMEAVFERFAALFTERDMATAFCHVIRQRSGETWSNQTLQRLIDIAAHHPHPAAGEFTVFRVSPSEEAHDEKNADVLATTLNCVRGAAASAIEALLWNEPQRLSVLQPAVDALIADQHPSVRIGAIASAPNAAA